MNDLSSKSDKLKLLQVMLPRTPNAAANAGAILGELADHALTLSHTRHLSAAKCRSLDLEVTMFEADPKLQEAILSVYHALIHTLSATGAYKVNENHKNVAFIQLAHTVVIKGPAGQQQSIGKLTTGHDA